MPHSACLSVADSGFRTKAGGIEVSAGEDWLVKKGESWQHWKGGHHYRAEGGRSLWRSRRRRLCDLERANYHHSSVVGVRANDET